MYSSLFPGWSYSAAPHISIPSLCTNHPAAAAAAQTAPPHLQPCQVHFSQPFAAQTCHYGPFASTQLTQIQPQSHQAPHYHQHMQQVRSIFSFKENKKYSKPNFRIYDSITQKSITKVELACLACRIYVELKHRNRSIIKN